MIATLEGHRDALRFLCGCDRFGDRHGSFRVFVVHQGVLRSLATHVEEFTPLRDRFPIERRRPADANRRRTKRRCLLNATIGLILEIGGELSQDAVAQRGGIGIATLYRHFPDQQTLLRAVVLDVLDRTIDPG